MVPVNEYKTLDIKLDKVNSYIPPIVVNEADNNGRRLKFTPTYEGQPVTGITSARMYYDPRPRDASSIGDYVDGTKDGDGWVFVIPPNTFTANVQGIASVSFTDEDGETYTRSMPIDVESGGTKIDSQGTRIDRLIATLEQMVNDFTMSAGAKNGPAGSQASVNVTRLSNGSYNLDFTIPTGEKGPKGDPGDLTTVAHDDTLTGSGTSVSPLGVTSGFLSSKKIEAGSDCNDMVSQGTFLIQGDCDNTPYGSRNVTMELVVYKMSSDVFQVAYVLWDGDSVVSKIYVRTYATYTKKWSSWVSLIDSESLSDINTSLLTVETKAQALETKTTYKPITDETDLHTLFGTTGFYIKKWGTTVQNAPNSVANGIASTYLITVVSNGSDGYMRIDPMAGITDSYYLRRTNGDISSWYKITATEVSE